MLKVARSSRVVSNQYMFNAGFLDRLTDYIGVKNMTIMQDFDMSRSSFIRWRRNSCVTIGLLIQICNKYNLRMSWFISPSQYVFQVPDNYNKLGKPWHFRFNAERLLSYFGTNGISWREASRLTGHSRTALQSWCSEKATVDQFLYIMNTFRIPITDIISDNTLRDIDCTKSYMREELLRKQILIDQLIAKLKIHEINQNEVMLVAEAENDLNILTKNTIV